MDNRSPKSDPATGAIPRLDTGRAGPVALIGADLARFQDIAASAEDYYGWTAMRIGDRLSRRWLEKSDNPYRAEIAEVALAAFFGITPRPARASQAWASISNQMRNLLAGSQMAAISGRE